MDNLDDSENNAKISDSAYSNSCSNSQSRRSHSSKSTRSGSNSSGSSGYGGKPVSSGPSGYSNNLSQPLEKRTKEKEIKKKKKVRIEQTDQVKKGNQWPPAPVFEKPQEECNTVRTPPSCVGQSEKGPENMDVVNTGNGTNTDELDGNSKQIVSIGFVANRRGPINCENGFMCVISMQDGVVMYTAPTITTALGYPKELWIGRSFMDFVHPRDCNTFAAQITNGLAIPNNGKGTQNKDTTVRSNFLCSMVCRIRRYRDLNRGFGTRDKTVTYMPFMLKFYYKNFSDEEGRATFLLIQASPFFSAFKTANEIIRETQPFVIRHSATGSLEYIDQESVPYLGYLPQDILNKDALLLYHPADLIQLCKIYEIIVREGTMPRSKPLRLMAQNGHYLKVETEWSSFINPWSKKLEFVIGKHYVIEGPANPDVFQSPEPEYLIKLSEEDMAKSQVLRHTIVRLMNEVLTKPAEAAKQQMGKRCHDLASFMETLMEDNPKGDDEIRLDLLDADNSNYFERDSVMLGGISPHHDSDSKSSTDTPVSYNQLNYNDNLERYFTSYEPLEGNHLSIPKSKFVIEDPEAENTKPPEPQPIPMEKEILPDSVGGIMPCIDPCSYEDYQHTRLTEYLLNKHNSEMEWELVKTHRENRSSKTERERQYSETRQKKKEHLARCNAYYQPTSVGVSSTMESDITTSFCEKRNTRPHDLPSTSTNTYRHRHEPLRRRRMANSGIYRSYPASNNMTNTPWPGAQLNSMNSYMYGVGLPQTTNLVSPLPYPGMIPLYYTPPPIPMHAHAPMADNVHARHHQRYSAGHNAANANRAQHYPVHNHATRPAHHVAAHSGVPHRHNHVPCMMMGQGFYGSPFLYPSVDPQHYAMPPTYVSPELQNVHSLGLPNRNYEEALDSSSQSPELKRRNLRRSSSSGTMDKTDEESSYSSFYSSFFKTDSGSAEDSDVKNNSRGSGKIWHKKRRAGDAMSLRSLDAVNPKRRHPIINRTEQQVRLTSELIYKYQIVTKSMEEVLSQDREKLMTLEQPDLVNDQLEQLYLDLQLEGVASRLTLEEGVTSSSSSGEESSSKPSRIRRRHRDYSRLVMIHEEDAPLPPPEEFASSSTS